MDLRLTVSRKLDRFKKVKAANDLVPARDNPLVIAFWTCLQLERYISTGQLVIENC
jgi:hypothetical protein